MSTFKRPTRTSPSKRKQFAKEGVRIALPIQPLRLPLELLLLILEALDPSTVACASRVCRTFQIEPSICYTETSASNGFRMFAVSFMLLSNHQGMHPLFSS